MDELMLGLYVLSLVACCLCLWFWYQLETMRDYVRELRTRIVYMDDRLEQVERRRR